MSMKDRMKVQRRVICEEAERSERERDKVKRREVGK